MAFRAVRASWGAAFAHLPNLGCGREREAVWNSTNRLCTRLRMPFHDDCGSRCLTKSPIVSLFVLTSVEGLWRKRIAPRPALGTALV